MRKWILGILTFVLVLAIFFEPSYGWKLREFLSPTSTEPGVQAATGTTDAASTANMAAENDALKAQLATLQAIASELPSQPQNYVRAMVYSRYPLNFKNEILVNVGTHDGIVVGAAAVFQGILVGKVIQVFPEEAVVQTVFDSGFEMPVRVSTSSYDGLFVGGSYPEVKSIAKTAVLAAGDIVYAAAPGIPYGLAVGEVNATTTSPDNLFNQATVAFPYDVNEIQTLLITNGT